MKWNLQTLASNRLLGIGIVATALALSTPQPAYAIDCPDVDIPANASSATANICGTTFNASLSSAGSFNAAGLASSAEGTINGIAVRFSSGNGTALNDITDDTFVKLFINGRLEYDGTPGNLSIAEGQRLLALLGGLEASAIQSDTARVGSTRTTSIIAGRIRGLFRPGVVRGAPASNALNVDGNDLKIRGLSVRDGGADPMRRDWNTGAVGLSAGDHGGSDSAWGSISNTWLSDDNNLTRFDGRLTLFTVGYDRQLPGGWVAGVAGVIETSDIDTNFNDGDTDTIGGSIVPYIGKSLFDGNASFDVQAGYGRLNTDTARNRSTGIATGDFDSYRLFGAANLAGYHQSGPWLLTGRVGVLATHEGTDEYTESNGNRVSDKNVTLVQVSVGGETRYSMGNWSPYVGVTYINDVNRSGITALAAARDDDEVKLEAGTSFIVGSHTSADLAVTHSLGRSEFDETTVLGSLRYTF
jgi:hypothetical protein